MTLENFSGVRVQDKGKKSDFTRRRCERDSGSRTEDSASKNTTSHRTSDGSDHPQLSHYRERLEFNPERDIMKGGMDPSQPGPSEVKKPFRNKLAQDGKDFIDAIKPLTKKENDAYSAIFEKRYNSTVLTHRDSSDLEKDEYLVQIQNKGSEALCYKMYVMPKEGFITVPRCDKRTDNDAVEGTSPLPASEMLWHGYRLAMKKYGGTYDQPNIKKIYINDVANYATRVILENAYKFDLGEKRTVTKDDELYHIAMLTPLGKIVGYAWKQHAPHLDLDKIEFRKADFLLGSFGDMTFYLNEKEPSTPQQSWRNWRGMLGMK